jgi:hypothetical protein
MDAGSVVAFIRDLVIIILGLVWIIAGVLAAIVAFVTGGSFAHSPAALRR